MIVNKLTDHAIGAKEEFVRVFVKLKKIRPLEILFIITMGVALVHQLDGYIIPNYVKYGCALLWIVIWLFKMKVKKKDFKIVSLFISPYFLIGGISLLFWGVSSQSMIGVAYLGNLVYHIGYAVLRAMLVLAVLEIFRQRAFNVTFKALIFSEFIILMYVGMSYGFDNLLHYCVLGPFTSVVNGFEWATPMWHVGWAMEVHDNTFAFGVFLLYFLFCEKDGKYRKWDIIISGLFVYLGLKRIEILAIACVAIVVFIKRILKASYRFISQIGTTVYLIVAYVFIASIKWAPEAFSMLDINRIALYRFLSNQLQPESLVIGKGFSIINEYLLNYNVGSSLLTSSHSDVVRMAIELGILFFTLWVIYYLYIIPKKLERLTRNEHVSYMAFLCFFFVFITYFIDNTLELFAVQTMCMMVPIGLYKKKEG